MRAALSVSTMSFLNLSSSSEENTPNKRLPAGESSDESDLEVGWAPTQNANNPEASPSPEQAAPKQPKNSLSPRGGFWDFAPPQRPSGPSRRPDRNPIATKEFVKVHKALLESGAKAEDAEKGWRASFEAFEEGSRNAKDVSPLQYQDTWDVVWRATTFPMDQTSMEYNIERKLHLVVDYAKLKAFVSKECLPGANHYFEAPWSLLEHLYLNTFHKHGISPKSVIHQYCAHSIALMSALETGDDARGREALRNLKKCAENINRILSGQSARGSKSGAHFEDLSGALLNP